MKHLILAALLPVLLACGSPGSHPEPKLAGEWSVAARFPPQATRCTGTMSLGGSNASLAGALSFEPCKEVVGGSESIISGALIASATGWDGSLGAVAGHIEWGESSPTGRPIDIVDGVYGREVLLLDIAESGSLEAWSE